jgi:hypothetical protein
MQNERAKIDEKVPVGALPFFFFGVGTRTVPRIALLERVHRFALIQGRPDCLTHLSSFPFLGFVVCCLVFSGFRVLSLPFVSFAFFVVLCLDR